MARGTSKTAARACVTSQRRLEAFNLRLKGYTHQQIADALGIKKPSAHQLVVGALADHHAAVKEAADELRTITLMQIDDVLKAHLALSAAGDSKSAAIVLKALAERAKLMGLYAPTRTELTGRDGGPVQSVSATAGVDLTALSTEQLTALEAILQAAQGAGPASN